MKTNNAYSADLFTPAIIRNHNMRIRVLEEEGMQEDAEQLRECLVVFVLDRSGSMYVHEEDVYNAVQQTLMSLAHHNKTNLKINFRAKIVLFNDTVTEVNETALPPEQLSEVFTRDMLNSTGGTNLTAMYDFNDRSFSRTSPMVTSRKKGDCKIIIVTITDCVGTDDPEERKKALERVNSNRLAKQMVNRICVYVGPESNKNEAVLLAGSEENIIALSKDLSEYLAPTLINTTITYVDSTHIDYEEDDQTPSSVGKKAVERQEAGHNTAESLTNKDLDQKLAALLGV